MSKHRKQQTYAARLVKAARREIEEALEQNAARRIAGARLFYTGKTGKALGRAAPKRVPHGARVVSVGASAPLGVTRIEEVGIRLPKGDLLRCAPRKRGLVVFEAAAA